MRKFLKSFGVLALVAASLVALAGCASYSRADAYLVPYSVIETGTPGWSDYFYSYVDSEGDTHELSVCERPGFFDQMVCSSDSGIVQFAFSKSKYGATTSASVTVDGVKYPMTCTVNSDDSWSSLDVCIPNESGENKE